MKLIFALWVAIQSAGCVGSLETVVLNEGEGAIIFGWDTFLAVFGGRDQLEVIRAFDAEGSQIPVDAVDAAVSVEGEFCVDAGYSRLNLELMEAHTTRLPERPVLCRRTGAYPCIAVCAKTSSVSWWVWLQR